MSLKSLTERQMLDVAWENARNFGAVSDDVARDIGIAPFADIPEVVTSALADQKSHLAGVEKVKKETTSALGAFMCGDCLINIQPGQSCGHIRIDANGNRRILG